MPLAIDPEATGEGSRYSTKHMRASFADAGYSGYSFNLGLLRFHDSVSGPQYQEHLVAAFPELAGIDPDVLAFDWMGRQLFTTRTHDGSESDLFLADLGVGEIGKFCTVDELTGIIKLPNVSDAFDGALFDRWKQSVGGAGKGIGFSDCVEYQMPLYLGGEDSVENLALIDMDVSWTLGAQIRLQTRELKPGEQVSLRF